MAPRRRLHARRLVVLLALLLLCLLLLDLNRFFPGVWPGGGGTTGSRPVATGVVDDPSRVRAPDRETPDAERPAARLRVVVVAPPDESAPPDARVTAGAESKVAALAGGRGVVELSSAAVEAGDRILLVTRGDRSVVHGVPRDATRGDVVVALPANGGAAVAARDAGSSQGIAIHVADDRGPLANAEVRVTDSKGERALHTDASGRVEIERRPKAGAKGGSTGAEGAGRSTIVRICATAEGHSESCSFASFDGPAEITLTVPRLKPVTTQFVSESGEPLAATTLRIVPRGGAPRTLERPEGGYAGLSESLPADLVASGHVEIEVAGRPTVRVPLSGVGSKTVIPAGRRVKVTIASDGGGPSAGATVAASWPAEPGAEPADAARLSATATADSSGVATLVVPKDRDATVVVRGEGAAPSSVVVARSESDETRDVTTTAGASLRVRVLSTEGAPIAGATVLVLSRVGDAADRASATSDREGIATITGLLAGRVEALAHAPGRAWGVATATVAAGSEATAEARLSPGRRLRLVVEDPLGVPIASVSVRSSPRPDPEQKTPFVPDPDAAPWTTDLNGVLVVSDLPDVALDLFLHRDGYADETVSRARPGDVTYLATLVPAAK